MDVVDGLREYIEFFVSDDMAGPDGPLADYGLVSDPVYLDLVSYSIIQILFMPLK